LKRSLRLTDIYQDQIRALRIRSFVEFLKKCSENSLYLSIEQSAKEMATTAKRLKFQVPADLTKESLPSEQVKRISNYPTALHKVLEIDANNIVRHGYESLKNNQEIYWNKRQS